MAENKFIKHLKGEQAVGSLVEIKNQNTPASFGNMPQGTSDSNVKYSDVRGDVTIVANGTMAWKINDSALTLAPIVNGDGTDYTGKYELSGAGLWVNSTYIFPSTGDPNHPVAMIFNPNTKWVLKLCGDNLIVNNGETLELNVIITIGTSNIISKQFTIKEQANQFCKELVIDFDESNASMIKASGLATLQLQVLCGTADASARIYNGMTTLTVLQRKVDASVVSGTFANVEEVMRDGLLPNDYFSNAAYIAQITDGDTAYAVFTRDGDDVALSGWAQPIPDQTNNAGKFLTTDGSLMSWEELTISNVSGLQNELDDLQNQIDDLSGRGRFLALWNCATGLAESNPPESPYPYKAGDYFVVGTVSSATPAVNYKPDGSSYTTGVASTTVETNEVSVNDTYFYDGTVWKLQSNAQKEVSFSALAGSPYDNTNLSNALNAKQDKLTAGTNITIDANNVISSTAQESFFRGNFNEWSDVPTNPSLYQEDIHGNRVPKDTDFIIVEDASQFIPSGSLMHKLVVENLAATEAFTIRITDENGVSQKYYYEPYARQFVAIDDYYSLRYDPGNPGIWSIKTNDGSPIIIKGTTYSSGQAQLCLTTDPATPFDAGMPPSAGQYTGAWRFAYYGVWSTAGITGWTPQYKIENTLPIADDQTLGIAKLYTTTGSNTDGAVDQATVTSALGGKQDTLTAGTNITIDANNVISSTSTESFFRGPFANWANVPTTVYNYYPDIYGNKTPRNTDYIIIEDASQVPAGGDTISMTMRTDVYAAYPTQELTTVIGSESYTGTGIFGDGEIEVRIDVFAGYWSVFWKNLKNEVVFGGTTYPVGSDFNIVQILPSHSGTSTATLGISYPYSGTWRFGYRGQWNLEGRGGWKGEYAVEETLPIADDQTLGIAKLYTTTGQNTDGSMTQKSITDALDVKANNTNRVNGAPLSNSASVFYGTSDTAAATTEKEVSIPSITTLDTGTIIIVQPTITSTVANSTIKLNNFTAYPMRYNNAAITTSTDSVVWNQNYPSIFVFDGTYWVFAGHGLDSNTTYSTMSVSEGTTGTATSNRVLQAVNLKQIIQGTTLTGIDVVTTGAVSATDTITEGIGKLQATKADTSVLATVATTGDYDDLLNKPTIPAAQVNSDWNANSGVAQILNKPTLAAVATSGAYSDLSGTPSLAAVATSGSYSDLTGTPTIPTKLSELTGDVDISSATAGQHLVYDGSKWKNTASSASVSWGGITGTLSNQTDLQNALNAKENTITGAATTITANNLAAARALVSNSTGKVAVSNVTSTELGYMHGVTSNVQTQLNNKQATLTAGNGIDITGATISVDNLDCGTM